MKILIIHCSFIYTGGGERIVLEQIDNLTRRGNKVTCYTPILDEKKCFPDIIKKYNIKTFLPQLPQWVPLRHAVTMLLSCISAPLFAQKAKDYDIIIGENQPGAWFAYIFSLLTKKPYIVYLNHPNRILYPRQHEDWAAVKDFKFLNMVLSAVKPILKVLDAKSIKSAKRILVNGVFIGKEIEGVYKTAWTPCPSGAMRSKIEPQMSESITVNGRIIDKPYILYTGRHQPWKRIDWLIEIGEILHNIYKNFYIIIPGAATPHTKDLKTLTRKKHAQEYMLFVGDINQDQLNELYNHATVYAFPSEKEDFGIVVIEAMGHGVPVVAWNVGGPTDSIVNNKTGYLIEPYDKKKFAIALEKLISNKNLRDQLSKNAQEHVSKNFSWTKHTNILETEIKRILLENKKKI